MKLKTKVISAICAGALALSMPALAFADPTATEAPTSPLEIQGNVTVTSGGKDITATSSNAAGISLKSVEWNNTYYGDMADYFGITSEHFLGGIAVEGDTVNAGLNATVTVVAKLMNKTADGTYTALVLNKDGNKTSWSKQAYTVKDGYATITLSKFSTNYVTFTNVKWGDTANSGDKAADATKTSPKTGIAA